MLQSIIEYMFVVGGGGNWSDEYEHQDAGRWVDGDEYQVEQGEQDYNDSEGDRPLHHRLGKIFLFW